MQGENEIDSRLEATLSRMIVRGQEDDGIGWASAWKMSGGKVIGCLTPDVPEELIYAFGLLPWHVRGFQNIAISRARQYWPDGSCEFCSHVLESILAGRLDFLDGVVIAGADQEMVRLWDVWSSVRPGSFVHLVHFPHHDLQIASGWFRNELEKLISSLEAWSGVKMLENSLRRSMVIYEEKRSVLRTLYSLRKRSVPPLSGSEMLGLQIASLVMPPEEFNKEIRTLLPYLFQRECGLKHLRPRLLLISESMDSPAYVEAIENTGCLVAMDDSDLGSRYCWSSVNPLANDPLAELAHRYLLNTGCARHSSAWGKHLDELVEWVKEFNIDGVMVLRLAHCYPRAFWVPFFQLRMKALGIPTLILQRDYHLGGVGQLQTRVAAFAEMLNEITR